MSSSTRRRKSWRRRLLHGLAILFISSVLISLLPVLMLRWLPPPTSAFMLGHWISQSQQSASRVRHPQYEWVDWDVISPAMRLAVVAAEDQKFPRHRGFDTDSMQQAVRDYWQGGDLRGASTISQQVAKNLFLWPDKSLLRKGVEAWFTLLIELSWPKQRILEVYLNIAEFGPGIYGVEAASRHFFTTTAATLDARQAALLAGVLPNPKTHDAGQPGSHLLQRRDWILQQMHQLGGPAYLDSISR